MIELEPIAIDEVVPAAFRAVLHAWFRQKGAACYPPVAELTPFVVPALVANAILVEVDGDSYRYRLVGDAIRQIVKRDVRNLSVAEVFGDTAYARLIAEQFRLTIAIRLPLYSVHHFRRPDDRMVVATWRIVMPYAAGERVTRLLAFQQFDARVPVDIDFQSADPMARSVFKVAPPDPTRGT